MNRTGAGNKPSAPPSNYQAFTTGVARGTSSIAVRAIGAVLLIALAVGTTRATVTEVGDVLPIDDPFTLNDFEGLPSGGNFVDDSQPPGAQTNFENNEVIPGYEDIEAGIIVGQRSFGRLDIDGNSQLRYQTLVIGDEGELANGDIRAGTGFMLITGIDALYNNDPNILPAGLPTNFGSEEPRDPEGGFDLYVGRFGQGTLVITGGGRAEIQDAVIIGDQPGSTGIVTVDGFGATLSSGGFEGGGLTEVHQLIVGRLSDGFMNIGNGGTVVSEATQSGAGGAFDTVAAVIGSDPATSATEDIEPGGRGTVTVAGQSSKWILGGTLQIGGFQERASGGGAVEETAGVGLRYISEAGRGTLYVQDGGLVSLRSAIDAGPDTDDLRMLIGRFGRVVLAGGDIRLGHNIDMNEPLSDTVQILNDGVIEGSGRIFTGVFRNRYLGEIRVRGGEKLLIDSASEFRTAQDAEPLANFGVIQVLGTQDLRAELEFERAPIDPDDQDPIRPLFNLRVPRPTGAPASEFFGGLISAQHSVLRFRSDLENRAMVAWTAGENYVSGNVFNVDPDPAVPDDEGILVFSGPNTNVVFENDLLSNGLIIQENGADFEVLARHSFVTAGELRFELDPTNSSQISTAGDVGIAGKLTVSLSGFDRGSLSLGDTFTIITAGGQIGGVDLSDPLRPRPDLTKAPLFTSLMMPDLSGILADAVLRPFFTPTSVYLAVVPGNVVIVPLAGDYNDNGVVDAADYVLWRKNLNQSVTLPNDTTPGFVDQFDYDVWRANFGRVPGSGSALAVPEPASVTLMLCLGVIAILQRRHRC